MQVESKIFSKEKKSTTSEDDKVPAFIYAFRFQALQDYFDGSLTEKGIVLLEYLIMIGSIQLKKGHESFFHSMATIRKRTRISQNTASALIKEFKEYGFLETEVVHEHGRPITYFRMKYARIAARLGILFGDEEVTRSPAQIARIEARHQALKQLARKQVALRKRKQELLAT